MNELDIAIEKTKINQMTQYQMARLKRFAPCGHPYFNMQNKDLVEYFQKRFKEKGGMTAELSKEIGWEE